MDILGLVLKKKQGFFMWLVEFWYIVSMALGAQSLWRDLLGLNWL
jgi:hypothetical protein